MTTTLIEEMKKFDELFPTGEIIEAVETEHGGEPIVIGLEFRNKVDPEQIKSFIKSLATKLVESFGEIIGEDEKVEIETPHLFQSDSTPNEMGGYSSVPFYCSLCFMGEMDIQDNKLEDGNYACHCSVWDNSCGGKWIKWYDEEKAKKLGLEFPTQENFNNKLRAYQRSRLAEVLEKIKEVK
jgi:hypothetical protein